MNTNCFVERRVGAYVCRAGEIERKVDLIRLSRLAEAFIAKSLVLNNRALLTSNDVKDAVRQAFSVMCNCELSKQPDLTREIVEHLSLHLIYASEGQAANVYLLIPRSIVTNVSKENFTAMLDVIKHVVDAWYDEPSNGHCDAKLHDVVAYTLFKVLRRPNELYRKPLDWYHGVLIEEYRIADEVRHEFDKEVYRVGDVWIERRYADCEHPYGCYVYIRSQ